MPQYLLSENVRQYNIQMNICNYKTDVRSRGQQHHLRPQKVHTWCCYQA